MNPLKRNELEAYLAALDPNDGFRVVEVQLSHEHSLHAGFYQNGKPEKYWRDPGAPDQVTVPVLILKDPEGREYGDKQRVKLLLEAMGRFLNTGGTVSELNTCQCIFQEVMPQGSYRLMPEGFYLINSHVNEEGRYEHTFAADDNPFAIIWVEGQFFDVRSLVALKNEITAEESEEPNESDEADTTHATELDPSPLQLGEDSAAPADDKGSAPEDLL